MGEMGSRCLLLSPLTDDFSGAFHLPCDSHTNPDMAPADGSCFGDRFEKKKRKKSGASLDIRLVLQARIYLRLNVEITCRVYSGPAWRTATRCRCSLQDQWDESQHLKAGSGKHPQFSWRFLPPAPHVQHRDPPFTFLVWF